jgi:pimeloyl-ACP methyl ester carboxylesterase
MKRIRMMRTATIEHEGLTFGLLAAGDPARPAILLLHGWPQCKEVYAPVMDALASGHFVLAFDLPEIGDSRGAPRSAEKTALAESLIGAAERAGARSLVVAGFDVGGMIAYAAARDHGHRLSGAVVMNTAIPGLDPWEKLLSDPRIWHFAFHALPELPELLVAGHQRAYFDFFTNVLAGRKEAMTEACRDTFASAYERPESLKAGFDWYRTMQADAQHNRQPKVIDTPMLYLRGDADGRSPEDYLPALKAAGAKRIQGEVLRGSGEFAPLEVPEAFIQAVGAFAKACQQGRPESRR